ncbi:MAG: hypothetical protein WA931_16055 [Rhodococcus sp. (in: high G+C Gram-positive bacteria)]
MEKTDIDPSVHIDSIRPDVRDDVRELDTHLSRVMAGHDRVLWTGVFWGGTEQSIIGYGDLVQERPRGKSIEWFIVGLAAQKNYISVYVNAVDDGKYLVEKYADTLGRVKTGKSSIAFGSLADVDLPALLELVDKARPR